MVDTIIKPGLMFLITYCPLVFGAVHISTFSVMEIITPVAFGLFITLAGRKSKAKGKRTGQIGGIRGFLLQIDFSDAERANLSFKIRLAYTGDMGTGRRAIGTYSCYKNQGQPPCFFPWCRQRWPY